MLSQYYSDVNHDSDNGWTTLLDKIKSPKVSEDVLNFYKNIELKHVPLSDTSQLLGFAKGMEIADEEFLAFISDTEIADKSLEAYKKQLQGTSEVAAKFSSALKTIGINLAITLAITAAVKAFDYLNVTLEEQQEIVDNLENKINGLQTEYNELFNKGNLTGEEKNRLDMLGRQLEVQKELYKVEMKRLALNELEGKGDIFSKGSLASLEDSGSQTYGTANGTWKTTPNSVNDFRSAVQQNIDKLEEYRQKINEVENFDFRGSRSLVDMEAKTTQNLKDQRTAVLEKWQEYSDDYETIKKYMDAGAFDDSETEKKYWEDQMSQYENGMHELEGIADNIDLQLGLSIDTEQAKKAILSQVKDIDTAWLDSLSEEEIAFVFRLDNLGEYSPDELYDMVRKLREEAGKEIIVKIDTSASGLLSRLDELTDGFAKFSAIYKDVQDQGDFDFSALINEDFANMFADCKDVYEDFVSTISNSPADIRACQSAFDDLVSAWFYGQDPLKNITEETKDLSVAWLEQQGVTNALEVANYALAQSEMQAVASTMRLSDSSMQSIAALQQEAEAAGYTGDAFIQLAVAIIEANQCQLSTDQQVEALYNLAKMARTAGDEVLRAMALQQMGASAANQINQSSDGAALRYAREQGKDPNQIAYEQLSNKLKQDTSNRPELSISGGTSGKSGSSGSSGSSSEKDPYIADIDKYKDLKDAVEEVETQITHLNQVYEHTDSIEDQISLNDVLIGLYQEQKDALIALNNARDKEIADNVANLRGKGFDVEYDAVSDRLKIKNMEHINELDEKIREDYDKLISDTLELNDANKDSAEEWTKLTFSIKEASDAIDELRHKRFEETISDAEHLISLMENRKDTQGQDLVVYERMMNYVIQERERLVADGYEKNKSQIQELERQWIDLYDTRVKREKELLEMQLDDKNGVISAVTNLIEEQQKGLEEQTKAIDEQISALRKANEERQEGLKLQQAQAALDKAKNQKTRMVLRKGRGWVYEADQDAIKEAEDTVADLKNESAISLLEKQKEALEKQKDALDEYKNLWAEIPNEYEKYQNELLAKEQLGADWEQAILDGRMDVYTDFRDNYFDLQDDIWQKTDELENHMNDAYLNMVKMFQQMASLYNTDLSPTSDSATGRKEWYVNRNGKAPSQAQVGDIVYTKGGTYQITDKDENGKFTSKKLNDNVSNIEEGMWGTEVLRQSNNQLVGAIGRNTLSNQKIIDTADEQVKATLKHILAANGLTSVTDENVHITDSQIKVLLQNTDLLNGNSASIDGNTVQIGDNTYAIEELTDAVNSVGIGELLGTTQTISPTLSKEYMEAGLKALSSSLNPFDGYDTSKMSDENKQHYDQLRTAYETAVSGGNAEATGTILSQLASLIIDSGLTANDMKSEYARLLSENNPYSRTDPLTGLSTVFTENSKSNAYGKTDVSGIIGTTKSIYGLDSSDVVSVLKELQRGRLTMDEAKKLVQISGGKYNADGTQKRYTSSGVDYSQWRSEILNTRTTASGKGEWVTEKFYDPNSDKTITTSWYQTLADKQIRETYKNTSGLLRNLEASNYAGDASLDVADSNNKLVDSNEKLGSSISSTMKDFSDSVKSSCGSLLGAFSNNSTTGDGATGKGSKKGSSKSGSVSSSGGTGISSVIKAISSGYNTIKNVVRNATASASASMGSSSKSSSKGYSGSTVASRFKKKARGGHNLVEDIYNIDEYGRKELVVQPVTGRLIHLSQGSTVIPANAAQNLMTFGENPTQYMENMLREVNSSLAARSGGGIVNHYSVQNVTLPNVQDPKEFWKDLTQNIVNEAKQWSARR